MKCKSRIRGIDIVGFSIQVEFISLARQRKLIVGV